MKDALALSRSTTVANARMNRSRMLQGPDSYEAELGMDLLGWMQARLNTGASLRWLDLCCGQGQALFEAAALFPKGFRALGLDLVAEPSGPAAGVEIRAAILPEQWPEGCFDLITCVHGLHYLGDKLRTLDLIAASLEADGLFLGNLETRSIRGTDSRSLRGIASALDKSPWRYSRKSRRLRLQGPCEARFESNRFLGANDEAEPIYTGLAAVDSYYEKTRA